MRNLTKTLAVVSLLAPASAYPLGIGDIKLHSALNQNLNAEIALVLSGERASDIRVNLAPPDKFNDAGVPWSYFLSKIRFETVTRANGSVIIKLTSNEALKEPFLDLLLEVSGPKGSLYREFTVLVDPPSVYKQSTTAVLTSPERYRSEAQSHVATQSRTPSRKVQRNFVRRGEFGPTRRNDTLWKVAARVRPDNGISVEQMMIALYEENPRAFYQENVNALSAGKTLNVPERKDILKLSHKEALAEFNRQNLAWNNRLARSNVEDAPAKVRLDNQLTLNAPTDATVTDKAVVAPGNDKTDNFAQSNSGKSGSIDAADPIQIKIAALEKQLATMQQIVALKDQQLAALQNQAQAKPLIPTQPVQPESVQQENQPAPLAPAIEEPAVKQEPIVKDEPVQSAPVVKEQPTQAPPKVAESIRPAQPVQPEAESSSDLYFPIISGIGATVLSALGWLWWRKRKVDEETNTESMFASSAKKKAFEPGAVVTDSMINQVNAASSESSSFLSEFAATDFNSFDLEQGEIDPVSEADVYLAYGRYHQAEELIQQAIDNYPERNDLKLKLLEIFQAMENKKGFESFASELAASGKRNDLQFWAKVAGMANEVCPDSSLFSSDSASFETEMKLSSPDVKIDLDKKDVPDLDGEEDTVIMRAARELIKPDFDLETESNQDSVLNFDLDSFSANDDIALSAADDGQKNNTSIDFDLNIPAVDSSKNNETNIDISADAGRVVDFDFNGVEEPKDFLADIENIRYGKNSNGAEAKTQGIDFNADEGFEGLDFSFEDPSDLEDSNSSDFAENDFNYESDQSSETYGVSDLTDMDEYETKLDLARAYIDMGDGDSAKNIVKEVFDKGSPEQRKIAQMLMLDLN